MTVEHKKSAEVTLLDSASHDPLNTRAFGKVEIIQNGSVTFTTAAASGSTGVLARLPIGAIITSIKITCTASSGFSSGDFGVYTAAGSGGVGTVISKDCLKKGQSLASAISTPTEILTTRHKTVYEHITATLNAAPDTKLLNGPVDIVVTAETIGSHASTITAEVRYCIS